MFQNTAYIPLIVDEKTIVEELECEVICELDCNGEPFVSDIYIDNLKGKGALRLTRKSEGFAGMLFAVLEPEAFEYVKGDVADQMREAA